MEKKITYFNKLLALVLGVGFLIGMVWRAFVPNVVLPKFDIPSMVALVLIALLAEYFIWGTQKRSWPVLLLLSVITFALLPLAAGLECAGILVTVCGTVVTAVITWLFDGMTSRLEVTAECKLAVIPTAFVMYLACQCFMGMI